MKFIAKVAAVGAAAAISVTGLVSATGASASAAPVSKTYSCVTPVGTYDVPVSFTLPPLPSSIPAGTSVPAGLPVSAGMALPSDLLTALGGLLSTLNITSLQGAITGNSALGSVPIPTTLDVPSTPLSQVATSGISGTGSLGAFTVPSAPGTYSFSVPTAITAALIPGLGAAGAAQCTLPADQAAVGSITVTPAASSAPATLSVSAPKKVNAGKVVKVKVTTTATGTSVAKIKGKKVAKATVSGGKATLKVKKGLKKGVNKIVVTVGSLSKTVKVKVS